MHGGKDHFLQHLPSGLCFYSAKEKEYGKDIETDS